MQKKPFSDQITKDNEGEEMGEKIKEGVGVRIVHFFFSYFIMLTHQTPFLKSFDWAVPVHDHARH